MTKRSQVAKDSAHEINNNEEGASLIKGISQDTKSQHLTESQAPTRHHIDNTGTERSGMDKEIGCTLSVMESCSASDEIEKIKIPEYINGPYVIGSVGKCDSILIGEMEGINVYSLNLSTGLTRKVMVGETDKGILAFLPLDKKRIICAKRIRSSHSNPDELVGCVSLYDNDFKFIKDFSIPKKDSPAGKYTFVAVDATTDGMIMASEWFQSKIYMIDPGNGKIVKTLESPDLEWTYGVLSTGDMVAETSEDIVIVDSLGHQKAIAPVRNYFRMCTIDRKTDMIYHLQWDSDMKICVIDQISTKKVADRAKRIATFPLAVQLGNSEEEYGRVLEWLVNGSRIVVTPGGKLIACDGKHCIAINVR